MPSRVIRADILSSESLCEVSMEAEMVFVRLLLLADDYGRLDGRSKVLRAALFPLRSEVTVKKLEKWIAELLLLDDPPLIQYVVDGRPYLELTGWEKHRGRSRRAKTSKYPPPNTITHGDRENDLNASPEILETPGDPPVGMEARVRGMEAREIPGKVPEIVGQWSLSNPKLVLKPIRFEAEARDHVLEWAKRRKYGKRILDDVQRVWEAWGPTKDFKRPMSSWVGSFKNLANKAIDEGKVKLETEDERYARELASSPLAVLRGGRDDAA